MSFQAYLNNIQVKTGKTPEDFKKLAEKKGLFKPTVKAGEVVKWLKEEFDLGHGHAMAIYTVFKGNKEEKQPVETAIEKYFSGSKSRWRPAFEILFSKLKKFGPDIKIVPANSYLSIVRNESKIAIVQATAARLDIGIKLKHAAPTERFEPAGAWNSMVTHRASIIHPKGIDKELIKWLHDAYEQNVKKK